MEFNIFKDYPEKVIIFQNILGKYADNEIKDIFNNNYSDNPVIGINDNIENKFIEEIHLFHLFEFMLFYPGLSNGKGIKLSPNGWLNSSFCRILYDNTPLSNKLIQKDTVKKIDEHSKRFIETLHSIFIISGIARKYNNHLIITKKGEKIKTYNRQELLKYFLKIIIEEFSWESLDSYNAKNAGQYGFLWILLNLKILGDVPLEIGYYYMNYINFFIDIENSSNDSNHSGNLTPPLDFQNAFSHRVFENILTWINCIKITEKIFNNKLESKVIKTDLFDHLFVLK